MTRALLNSFFEERSQTAAGALGLQFKIFKKELHLPSPFAQKVVTYFGQITPKFLFFVNQGGANRKDCFK